MSIDEIFDEDNVVVFVATDGIVYITLDLCGLNYLKKKEIWTKKTCFCQLFSFLILKIFFSDHMTPNTNQGYFWVELDLFYYILKKKGWVFELSL